MSGAAAMTHDKHQMTVHPGPATRATPFLAACLAALALSACAGPHDSLTTGGIPDDYRARHPIVVAEAQQAVDIPVASTDHRLTAAQRDVIRGFAANYIARASGPVYVMTPEGSPNTAAAYRLRGQIRAELSRRGIASTKIVNTSYAAAGPGDAAPIRLSFVGTTAITTQCGEWPANIAADLTNQNYYNFGCASQNNLAAQIANPEDLVAPRGMTPIDAQRRNNAIQEYRTTTTTFDDMSNSSSGF